jgi:hypothetical protein
MQLKALLTAIVLLIALAAGWQLLNTTPDSTGQDDTGQHSIASSDANESLNARIVQLEAELATEKTRNAELEQRLLAMQDAELDRFENEQELTDASEPPAGTGHTPARSSIPALQALTDAGIPLATAEAMRDWIGQNRLAMLNLRDRAEREGWLNTTRYATELRKLIIPTYGLREQYGDDMYDRFLYATGKSNRVVAADVYSASAAGASGIMPGDIVYSYANKTIFSMNDLKQATLEGEAGESVLVLLQRDGVYFSITVPRGPLGIEMRMESHAPE